jgi:hypothetical protein
MTFKKDYQNGMTLENEFYAFMEKKHPGKVDTTQHLGNFPGYDVKLNVCPGYSIKYECKRDLTCFAKKTFNACLELCKGWVNGKQIPGGLTATTADYLVMGFECHPHVYIISVKDMWRLVKQKKHTEVSGPNIGNANCLIMLWPFEEFAKHAKILYTRK